MKNKKLLLALLIVPWLTIPFVGRGSLKRFMPAAIFIAVITKVMGVIGEKRKWWKFYRGIFLLNSMDIFNLGPYMVSSIWMLKLTYDKVLTYFISNKIIHLFFIIFGLQYIERFKIFSLRKLTKPQYWLTLAFRAYVLYAFQFIKEKLQKPY